MVEVGSLYADLILLLDKYKAGLAEAKAEGKKAGQDLGRALSDRPIAALKEVDKTAQKVTWNIRGYIKDTSRVVTGILISQTFYQLIRVAKQAANALWDFHQQLEMAKLSFKYLLGSFGESEQFLYELQTLIAKTPFTFETALTGAKRLKAFGFTAKQLLPTLEILGDTAAVTGMDVNAMDRLILAMGQVLAKGRLLGQEIRQFSEVIPIMKILREELGLSGIAVQETFIPANKAIVAVLTWLQREYGGAARAMAKTTRGLLTNIHDYLLFIGEGLFQQIFSRASGFLSGVEKLLDRLRRAVKEEGLEGFLKAIFPPELASLVTLFLASFKQMGTSIATLIKAFAPLGKAFIDTFVRMSVLITPILATISKAIAAVINWILRLGPVAKILAGALTSLLIATVVSRSLTMLSAVVRFFYITLSSHPIVAAVTLITGALIALAMAIPRVRNALASLAQQMAQFFGIVRTGPSLKDYLKSQMGAGVTEGYAGGLEEIAEGFNDVADNTADATKEMKKFLLPFDEVYNIPEEAEKAGALDMGLGDLATMPDLSGLESIGDSMVEARKKVMDEGSLIGQYLKWVWETIRDAFKLAGWYIVEFGKLIGFTVAGFCKVSAGIIRDFAATSAKILIAFATMIANVLVSAMKTTAMQLALIGKYVADIGRLIIEAIGMAGRQLGEGLAIIGGIIRGFFVTVWEMASSWFVTLWGSVTSFFGILGSIWKSAFSTLLNIVIGFGQAFVTTVVGLWDLIKDPSVAKAKEYGESVKNAWSTWQTGASQSLQQFTQETGQTFGTWQQNNQQSWADWQRTSSKSWMSYTVDTKKTISQFATESSNEWGVWAGKLEKTTTDFTTKSKGIWVSFGLGVKEEWSKMVYTIETEWTEFKFRTEKSFGEFTTSVTKAFNNLNKEWETKAGEFYAKAQLNAGNFLLRLQNALVAWTGNTSFTMGKWWNTLLQQAAYSANEYGKIVAAMGNYQPTIKAPIVPPTKSVSPATAGIVGHQHGAIFNKASIIKIAEGSTKEAAIPLSTEGLRPFAQAIVEEIGTMNVGASREDSKWVAIPIGGMDYASIERTLFVVRRRESKRVSGRTV